MTRLENFDKAAEAVVQLVRTVRAEQWLAPTACQEWNVRGVVNHLAHGNVKTAYWVQGGAPPEAGNYLGLDIPVSFADSVRSVRRVLEMPGLAGRKVLTPIGAVPGALLVEMRVNEYLAHGWDIADATGQPTDFLPELAEQALAAWRARLEQDARPPGSPFAPAVAPPQGASAADRLAVFLGRRPVGRS